MAHIVLHATKVILRRGGLVVAAALVLAGCSASHDSSSGLTSHPTPIATAFLNPNSICPPDEGDNVPQSTNGDYTACFRVPNLRSSSIVVALQTLVESTSGSPKMPLTTTTNPAPAVTVSLSSSAKTVTPGEVVVLTGHVSKPIAKPSLPNLCWDGCGGLKVPGDNIRWLSSTKFQLTLRVPETAWLVTSHGEVTVHPLTSGSYEVGVQCLTSISGCALRPAQAQTKVQLKAPSPTRCVRGQPCETMTMTPSKALVGDEVMVRGWAPLGQSFSYSLSVTAGPVRKTHPALAYATTKLGGFLNVVLTPTPLRIGPSPPWADLGKVSYLSSTYSGPTSVDPATNSPLVAWCEPSGVVITGGATPVKIPVLGVRQALRGSMLQLFSHAATPGQCIAVQLDPRYRDSVYAGFGTAQGNSIPPVYVAPLYTTNAGATWHTVPIPKGLSIEDFGGFTTEGNEVAALFNSSNSYNQNVPQGTTNGYATAEVTSNGGASWTTATLGCPASGPCVTFGPYPTSHCGMSNAFQALLVGPSRATPASRVRWRYSTWVSTVNSCFAQQLVVSSPRVVFLLDPSSEYPLLRSTDGGQTWSNWEIPPNPAANYGPDSAPMTNSLVLSPDGSLFASITTPAGDSQHLYRLYPGATSWCQIPDAFGAANPQRIEIGPLRVDATDLLWSQSSPSSMHVESFSKLKCR
jgi:hypothetical protein